MLQSVHTPPPLPHALAPLPSRHIPFCALEQQPARHLTLTEQARLQMDRFPSQEAAGLTH